MYDGQVPWLRTVRDWMRLEIENSGSGKGFREDNWEFAMRDVRCDGALIAHGERC